MSLEANLLPMVAESHKVFGCQSFPDALEQENINVLADMNFSES